MTPKQEAALAELDAQLERITRAHPNLDLLLARLYQAAIIHQGRREKIDLSGKASAEQITTTAEAVSELADDLRLPSA